jgi:hypothetical protein
MLVTIYRYIPGLDDAPRMQDYTFVQFKARSCKR